MPRRDTRISLLQMRDHAQEALTMVEGRTRADLDSDRMLNLAVVRLLEILGEAANRVSPEDQHNYPQIPWSQLVSLRNRLIHGCDQVDFNILWQILTLDLPGVLTDLQQILSSQR